ncbi:hypothetical protein CC86DRAFT_411924 [Ophiobolus disseminans]|uniref:Uncharacterized protein n=1 Tax=Ophiobolus disseminans TaxID=1469910 RepID=A0A6A6ZHW0_9PLEO|nr:hypothetical protein CC86DRAFT_411924 [Ophiobolus disseminans]
MGNDWVLWGRPNEVYTSYNRGLSGAASQLFDIVWEKLGLDYDSPGVGENKDPVIQAYRSSPIAHTGNTHVWQRPPFCKCQPFGGLIRKHLIDSEEKDFVDSDMYGGVPE